LTIVPNAVIAIAGSSGLIGSALVSAPRPNDHRGIRIVRPQEVVRRRE